jgi:hypothetical protein
MIYAARDKSGVENRKLWAVSREHEPLAGKFRRSESKRGIMPGSQQSQSSGEPCTRACRPHPVESCRAQSRRVMSRLAVAAFIALFCIAGLVQAQTTVNIHGIQTDLPNSPYLNDQVTTTGIVIGVLSDGFYIENPESSWDSNDCTAEGIYVYTPSGVPTNAVSGYSLTVTGTVEASNSSNYAGTQIYIASPSSTNVVTESTGNSLPATVSSTKMTTQANSGTCTTTSTATNSDSQWLQWLPFEGMRVSIPSGSSLLVTQGTGGTVTASSQTATSNGQFWAVLTTTRPFRATGISYLDTVPSTAPSAVSRWSGNPQLLLVDTTALGGTAFDTAAGTKLTYSSSTSGNLIGIIDYHVSTTGYTGLLLTSSSVSSMTDINQITATAATAPSSGLITIATQDLNNLTDAESSRISKLANAIVYYENSPDILAVQGVTPRALTLLESAITSAGGPTYSDLGTDSTVDSNGYENAFLVNTSDFDNSAVSQLLASNTYTTTSGATATLFDRSPLALTVGIPRSGTTDFNIVVVNSSLLDRANIDDATLGPDVRNRREQQAEALATQFETYEANGDHLFAVGGYNSFEFSDGYVDTLGIIDGNEAAKNLVTLYDTNYNTTSLEDTTTSANNKSTSAVNAASARHTYVESGSAEQPDHILITTEISAFVSIDYAHFGADFPVSETYDSLNVIRASNHDGVIAYLIVPTKTLTRTILKSSLNPSYYGNSVTFTATVSSTSGSAIPAGTVTFYDGSTELSCDAVTLDSSGAASCSTSTLTVGTHTITADYSGSSKFYGSSGTLSQVVDDYSTTSTLTCSPNPANYGATVTCTDTVTASTGTPSGTVTFDDGSTELGTGTLSSGVASYSTSTLSLGSHSITAVYTASGAYETSTSNTVTEIIAPTFSVTVTPSSRTVSASEAADYTVTVNPGSGFTLDVALTCSGLPSHTTCTFTPSTVSGGSGTSELVVQTTGPTQASTTESHPSAGRAWPLLAGILLLFVPKRLRRGGGWFIVLLLTTALAAGALSGCEVKGNAANGTPTGSYSIVVTGTASYDSATLTQTATVTLNVD